MNAIWPPGEGEAARAQAETLIRLVDGLRHGARQ
jgi:hypothetical protein